MFHASVHSVSDGVSDCSSNSVVGSEPCVGTFRISDIDIVCDVFFGSVADIAAVSESFGVASSVSDGVSDSWSVSVAGGLPRIGTDSASGIGIGCVAFIGTDGVYAFSSFDGGFGGIFDAALAASPASTLAVYPTSVSAALLWLARTASALSASPAASPTAVPATSLAAYPASAIVRSDAGAYGASGVGADRVCDDIPDSVTDIAAGSMFKVGACSVLDGVFDHCSYNVAVSVPRAGPHNISGTGIDCASFVGAVCASCSVSGTVSDSVYSYGSGIFVDSEARGGTCSVSEKWLLEAAASTSLPPVRLGPGGRLYGAPSPWTRAAPSSAPCFAVIVPFLIDTLRPRGAVR